jgi:hypothetical protein
MEFPNLPQRIAKLPRDHRGYPVPSFVRWINGKPDFVETNPDHWQRCVQHRVCWICGDPCKGLLSFVCGPSAAFTGMTTEPAAHAECAMFALRTCPFIMFPNRRRDLERHDTAEQGLSVRTSRHNPGVWLLWVAKRFAVRRIGNSAVIAPGKPRGFAWMREGRDATRSEVIDALRVSATQHASVNRVTVEDTIARAAPFINPLQD